MSMPPPIAQANLGMADSLIILVIALVVFGPRKLPQIGRQIGKLMYEFRKASNEFKWQMEEELRTAEEADRRKRLALDAQATAAAPLANPAPEPDATPEPRILPPSTGAPVAADHPTTQPTTQPTSQATTQPVTEPSPTEAAADRQPKTEPTPDPPVTEQAAHHG
jgi:sec-independent protein translocase protein TatB